MSEKMLASYDKAQDKKIESDGGQYLGTARDHEGKGIHIFLPKGESLEAALKPDIAILEKRIEELEVELAAAKEAVPADAPAAAPVNGAVVDPKGDMFAVITERDHTDPLRSRGAQVQVSYTADIGVQSALDRAAKAEGLGQVFVAKMTLVGTVEDAQKLL